MCARKDIKIAAFDEALSRLDQLTCNGVYNRLFNAAAYDNVSMLIINHHIDVASFVDRIVFLKENRQVLVDSHNDLIKEAEDARYYHGEKKL